MPRGTPSIVKIFNINLNVRSCVACSEMIEKDDGKDRFKCRKGNGALCIFSGRKTPGYPMFSLTNGLREHESHCDKTDIFRSRCLNARYFEFLIYGLEIYRKASPDKNGWQHLKPRR